MNSHPEDISHRDRESAERHQRDQFPAGTPRQSNTASLQIHQPVASRIPGAIHSPGGLLATHGGSGPPIPLGAPSNPVSSFGGPLQAEPNRPLQHNAQNASTQMFGAISGGHNPTSSAPSAAAGAVGHLFGGPLQQEGSRASQSIPFGGSSGGIPGGGHPLPASSGGGGSSSGSAMQQGQQPILNVSHLLECLFPISPYIQGSCRCCLRWADLSSWIYPHLVVFSCPITTPQHLHKSYLPSFCLFLFFSFESAFTLSPRTSFSAHGKYVV